MQCEQDTIVPGQGGRVLTPLPPPRPEQGLDKSPVRALEKPHCQLSPRRAPGCEAHRRPKGPGHSGGGVGAGASLLGCHPGQPQLRGMPLTHGGAGGRETHGPGVPALLLLFPNSPSTLMCLPAQNSTQALWGPQASTYILCPWHTAPSPPSPLLSEHLLPFKIQLLPPRKPSQLCRRSGVSSTPPDAAPLTSGKA